MYYKRDVRDVCRAYAEHRGFDDGSDELLEAQAVPFYGGGKGKYLIIHPSGRTTVQDRKPTVSPAEPPKEEEEDVGQEDESAPSEEPPNESVSVNLPPDNASVAEAKPVGLAIAGVGGVASSKPVATAVVGPGGLALAKPVATAIAGIPGAEALVGVAGNGGKQKHKAVTAAPSKNAGGKAKRSAASSGNRPQQWPAGNGRAVWPTYPLYKIPESHAWGFILRPVY